MIYVLFFEKCFVFWLLKSVLWLVLKSVLVVEATSENPFGNYCVKSVFQCLENEKSFEKVCQKGI